MTIVHNPNGVEPANVSAHQNAILGRPPQELLVMGELVNNGSAPANEFAPFLTFRDRMGRVITVMDSSPLRRKTLAPSERLVWFQLFQIQPVGWTTIEVEAREIFLNDPMREASFDDFVASDVQVTPLKANDPTVNYLMRAEGHITNTAATAANYWQVLVACYDRAGNLVGVGSTLDHIPALQPGETRGFVIIRGFLYGDVETTKVYTSGVRK